VRKKLLIEKRVAALRWLYKWPRAATNVSSGLMVGGMSVATDDDE